MPNYLVFSNFGMHLRDAVTTVSWAEMYSQVHNNAFANIYVCH